MPWQLSKPEKSKPESVLVNASRLRSWNLRTTNHKQKTRLSQIKQLLKLWTELNWTESRSVVSTLCDLMDYTVHGILQAKILEWVAFPFSRGSSQPRDRTQVSRIAGRFFTSWATREAHLSYSQPYNFLHHFCVCSLCFFQLSALITCSLVLPRFNLCAVLHCSVMSYLPWCHKVPIYIEFSSVVLSCPTLHDPRIAAH